MSAMDHITGADGTDEISQIQSLSDEVVGVGIDIGSSIVNLDLIDTDGLALNVPADQLAAALQATNPLTHLASVGDDVINGNDGDDGDDLIFGDAVNTDSLAIAHGISTIATMAGKFSYDLKLEKVLLIQVGVEMTHWLTFKTMQNFWLRK